MVPPPPADHREGPRGVADETFTRTLAGLTKVIDRITPWLSDLGSWIFGALIAFSVVILGALLTVGPVDPAVLIATAAFGLALPPAVAGFMMLRLAADLKTVALEDVATAAFQEVGFEAEQQVQTGGAPEPAEKRRMRIVLRYSYGLLALTVVLTVVGMAAALWHMAWWIALVFVATALVTQALVLRAIASGGSRTVWRTPK